MNPNASKLESATARSLWVGIAALGISLGAQAGDPGSPDRKSTSVVVSYSDLDLTDSAAARTLYARLKSAAREVCGSEPEMRELRQSADYHACYARALNKAVLRIDSASLHALHAARTQPRAVG